MSTPKKSALGKGLSAILGDANNLDFTLKTDGKASPDKQVETCKPEKATKEPKKVPVGNKPSQEAVEATSFEVRLDQIEPNPFQPRETFDQEALEELSASIATIGLVQPITVRRVSDDKYQIISGERRWRACRMAGLESIPVFIHQADDRGMLEMAIIENIQRENLDAIETALSFQRLIDECHLTQEQMADRIGKKRTTVTNFLRLLRLPAGIQFAIKQGTVSMGHAKVLLSVEEPETQLKLCNLIVNNGLSVRQLEERVAKMAAAKQQKTSCEETLPDYYYRLADIVGKYFNNNISFHRSPKGKGTMSVSFADDAQLERFLRALEESKL